MAISLTCPNCNKSLRVPDTAAGKAGKCPQCQGAIKVPQGGIMAAAAAAPAAAPPAAYGAAPAAAAVGAKPLAAGGPWLWIAAGAGGLFLVGFVIAGFMLLTGGGSSAIQYMPDNCMVFATVQVEEARTSKAYAELKKVLEETNPMASAVFELESNAKSEIGTEFSNVRQVSIGAVGENQYDTNGMGVIQTIEPVNAADMKKNMTKEYTEETEGDFTIHDNGSESFCLVDDHTIVFGPTDMLRKVLKRGGRPKLSPGMESALSAMDRSKTVAVAIDLKEIMSKEEAKESMTPELGKYADKLEGLVVGIDVGDDVELYGTLTCSDAETADSLRKYAEGGIQMASDLVGSSMGETVNVLKAIKIEASGNVLYCSMEIEIDSITAAIREASQAMPEPPTTEPEPF